MPFRKYCLCFAAIIYGVKKSENSVIFGVIKMFQMDTTGILIKIRKIVR